MTGSALGLILAAAVVHAWWNFLLKRAGGGFAFLWLFGVAATLLYAPLAAALLWWQRPQLGFAHGGLILASAVLHIGYYALLDRGYRAGELSVVYPLARGTGPLLALLGGVLILGEQPGPLGITGAALIGAGAILLTGDPRSLRSPGQLPAILYALLTGGMIAAYTMVDKLAVAVWLVPPLVQDWATNAARSLLLAPAALRDRRELAAVWRRARREILAIALLCPLAYILVLTAMVFTPVSYVAPAREISILFGALIGARLLREGDALRKSIAAGTMVAGMVCLAGT